MYCGWCRWSWWWWWWWWWVGGEQIVPRN
jgi:hypothetical protein